MSQKNLVGTTQRLKNLQDKLQLQKTHDILNLNDLIIGDEGCPQVCQFVREYSHFKIIEIRGNNISSYGFQQICNNLKQCQNLLEIKAEWNCIGTDQRGLEGLMQLLRTNKSIRSVDLKNNKIGPICAPLINEILKDNTQLRNLDLKWNELGNMGVEMMLEGLNINTKILNLDIRCNKLNQDLIIFVDSILQRNQKLKSNQQEVQPTSEQQKQQQQQQQENNKGENQTILISDQQPQQEAVGYQQRVNLEEVENIIENERRRGQQLRETYQREMEDERQLRIELENNIVRLKDVYLQKEAQVIQLEQKHNALVNENTLIYADITDLKKKILLLQENSTQTVSELNNRLNGVNHELQNIEQKHQLEINQILTEKDSHLQNINLQWEQRYQTLEQQYSQLCQIRNQLEQKLNNLQEEVLRQKMDHEDDQRNIQTRIVTDAHKKYVQNLEQLELRVKDAIEAKDMALRRNDQLMKEIEERDKRVHDDFISMEGEIATLREQLNEMHHALSKTNLNIEKLKSEIVLKDTELQYLQEKLNENRYIMEKVKNLHKEQIEHIISDQTNERRLWNESLENQHMKILELERALKVRELEQNRIKMDYENLCNIVQANIQKQLGQSLSQHDFRLLNQAPLAKQHPQNQPQQFGIHLNPQIIQQQEYLENHIPIQTIPQVQPIQMIQPMIQPPFIQQSFQGNPIQFQEINTMRY